MTPYGTCMNRAGSEDLLLSSDSFGWGATAPSASGKLLEWVMKRQRFIECNIGRGKVDSSGSPFRPEALTSARL